MKFFVHPSHARFFSTAFAPILTPSLSITFPFFFSHCTVPHDHICTLSLYLSTPTLISLSVRSILLPVLYSPSRSLSTLSLLYSHVSLFLFSFLSLPSILSLTQRQSALTRLQETLKTANQSSSNSSSNPAQSPPNSDQARDMEAEVFLGAQNKSQYLDGMRALLQRVRSAQKA